MLFLGESEPLMRWYLEGKTLHISVLGVKSLRTTGIDKMWLGLLPSKMV